MKSMDNRRSSIREDVVSTEILDHVELKKDFEVIVR